VSPTEAGELGLQVRPARPDECVAVANLYLRVRRDNLGAIPPVVHSDDCVRDWFSTVLLERDEVWVADDAGTLIGFVALQRPDWVDQLYVDGSHTGRGVGGGLLEVARRELGGRLQLWTFQCNLGARRFYERHGFVAVEQTDGDNEEGAPDVRYRLEETSIRG
jgi:GNAT superfamily N-acetyltransferase